jgi:hypothetical protein
MLSFIQSVECSIELEINTVYEVLASFLFLHVRSLLSFPESYQCHSLHAKVNVPAYSLISTHALAYSCAADCCMSTCIHLLVWITQQYDNDVHDTTCIKSSMLRLLLYENSHINAETEFDVRHFADRHSHYGSHPRHSALSA